MGGVPTPKDKDISLADERKNEAHERTAFTDDEAKRILQAANELGIRKGAMEWFRLCTGMRPGRNLGGFTPRPRTDHHGKRHPLRRIHRQLETGGVEEGARLPRTRP